MVVERTDGETERDGEEENNMLMCPGEGSEKPVMSASESVQSSEIINQRQTTCAAPNVTNTGDRP